MISLLENSQMIGLVYLACSLKMIVLTAMNDIEEAIMEYLIVMFETQQSSRQKDNWPQY